MTATALFLFFLFLPWPVAAAAEKSYHWRGLRVRQSTVQDIKQALGEPSTEYREQLLYEKVSFDPMHPDVKDVRLDTVVFNISAKGVIESIFLSPEWGTTDEQLRPVLGEGRKMSYRKFLSTFGEIKIGAGTRPNEKLHYVDLDATCEVYAQSRILLMYIRQDVVTGHYLIQLVVFY